MLLGVTALYVDFFPSRTWGIFSGALTFVAVAALLPQIFSKHARTVIDRSPNPGMLRKGQLTLGIGGMGLLWVFSWLALCQVGGSLITYTVGAPHSESVNANSNVQHRRAAIGGCRHYMRLAAQPNRWGNELCVSSSFQPNGPRSQVPLQLHGKRSFTGFKVRSYEA